MLKKLLFVVVTIAIVLSSIASAFIVPVQSSQQIEAADLTSTSTTAPSWKILVLIYQNTDFTFRDVYIQRHVVASMTQEEMDRAANASQRFFDVDVPQLDSGYMLPTVTIRYPQTLNHLDTYGNKYWPSRANTATELDPAFDSVVVIWKSTGVDINNNNLSYSLTDYCGLTPPNGTGQTYAAIPIMCVSSNQRNVFKHEWGHSILFYFAAAGTAPLPAVDNHINATSNQYVNCQTNESYILQDETDDNPIPNSIYNNQQGFTHDYYSGMTHRLGYPTQCLGITQSAWASGGPVSKPSNNCTLSTSSSAGGSVTTPGQPGPYTYSIGQAVNIVATPNAGYKFVNWTGSGVTAGKVANTSASSTTILMDADYSVQANFRAPSWSSMTSGITAQLNGIWGSSPSNVIAVGASGNIRYYNGNVWSKMTSGFIILPPSLNDVWGSNSSNVFAVGASGNIRYYNGNAWSKMTSGITSLFPPSLNGVWGNGANDVFAVGASGTILHYNGNAWSKMTSGITGLFPPSLNGVWGSSSSNVFAVGASGTIRQYNGTSWSGMTSGITAQLNGVWGSSSSNVFAVGASGTIRKYNGTSWSVMTSGTTKNLWGVWGTGPNDVFAVGDSGTVLHYNGTAWSTMSSSVTTALYSIWGSSFDNVFAVGASGKIIQYK